MNTKLNLGPILFNWPVDKWRDFYARIADEAPVDTVYIGEVVCSKREPLFAKHYAEAVERLTRGGKKVVFSSLAQVAIKHDRKIVAEMCQRDDVIIEANDASALYALRGSEFHVGPFVNVYNEDAMTFLASLGAKHFCLTPELPAESLAVMASTAKKLGITTETQVYGRASLALSARCYHARAFGRVKDNCQYACEKDPNGMEMETLEGQKFLAVNGIQTMTLGCLNLAQEVPSLIKMGLTALRLSPQDVDMVKVAEIFTALISKKTSAEEATKNLAKLWPGTSFINGFHHKQAGHEWVDAV